MNTTTTQPKFDWNKPFRTRDGGKAELLRKLNKHSLFQYVVLLTDKNGKEDVGHYTESGKLYASTDSPFDLINIPEKQKMWVNVYPDGMIIGRETRKEADNSATYQRIACVEVEFEYTPGQGLCHRHYGLTPR